MATSKRILLVQNNPYLVIGGAAKANQIIMEGLADRGYCCKVLCASLHQEPAKWMEQWASLKIRPTVCSPEVGIFHLHGVEVHQVAGKLSHYLRNQIREFKPVWTIVTQDHLLELLPAALEEESLSKIIYIARTTVILSFGPHVFFPPLPESELAKLSKEVREMEERDQREAKHYTELLSQTAGIMSVSHYLQDYFRQWANIESAVIRFPVYGGKPFRRFECFDEGFVTIVNPCSLKGIAIFLELARELPDVQFAAVPLWGTLEDDMTTLRKLPNIHLLEANRDIDIILGRTRILLAPSLWAEAFPQIVIQAMLRGIPVLGSDVGGVPEAKLGIDYVLPVHPIVRYKKKRVANYPQPIPIAFVPEQDIAPWVKALTNLLSDRVHYQQLSDASCQAAMEFVCNIDGVSPLENFLKSFV